MRSGWRRLWHELRGDRHEAVDLLRAQLIRTLDGVAIAERAVASTADISEMRARMRQAEQAGDAARGEVVETLAASIAPPLDREDLFRLSRSVDDVLDNLTDFVDELATFGGADTDDPPIFLPLLASIARAVRLLDRAVSRLVSEPRRLGRTVLAAKKATGDVRQCYNRALAELLVDPISARTLQQRELLRRLDVVGLRLGEAADALADGAVKRDH